ncbi:MAG TPA: site-specific integrase [Bacteroidales bacterium]|nr:site-specific integrase [Bacteroidales bacterium]HRZ49547.1 site-specific integrase [Bacteroidales bacterium]
MKRTTYKEPKFYLDGKETSSTAAIFLKYSFAPGQRITYFTGHRIDPNKWDDAKQRVRRNVADAREINDLLNKLYSQAQTIVRENRLLNRPLTKEMLKKQLDTAVGKSPREQTFSDLFAEFINSESKLKAWTNNTIKKLKTIRSQIEAFETYKRKWQSGYRIDVRQIDEKFFEEVIGFWQKEYDLRNSTVQKYIRLIRWFLQWCVTRDYTTDAFKSIRVNLKQTSNKVIYLDMEEIGKIFKTELPASKEYLQRTRDIFIFQCLTGLRYSDLFNLKANDIYEDSLHVNTIKTGEVVEIEFNDTTRSILAKYKDHQAVTGKALPIPHNQVYNRFLKELVKMAGLNEKITLVHYKGNERIEETFEKWQLIRTHTARRSFITNALLLDIAPVVIKSWTGHQSEKSFDVYIGEVKQRKKTDMNKMSL